MVLARDTSQFSCLELPPPSHPTGTIWLLNPLANDQKPCMPSPSCTALHTSRTLTKQAYKAEACSISNKARNRPLTAPETTPLPQPPATSTRFQCHINPQHAKHSGASHPEKSSDPTRKTVRPQTARCKTRFRNQLKVAEVHSKRKPNTS